MKLALQFAISIFGYYTSHSVSMSVREKKGNSNVVIDFLKGNKEFRC